MFFFYAAVDSTALLPAPLSESLVQRMASTRCSDNDRATVTLTRGKAALDA